METIYEVTQTRTLIRRHKVKPSSADMAATTLQSLRSSNIAIRFEMESITEFGGNEWQTSAHDEHPFIDVIRNAIEKYRLQSPAHYNLDIDVNQCNYESNPDRQKKVTSKFKVLVGFHNFGRRPVVRLCAAESQRISRKSPRVVTGNVIVYDGSLPVPFKDFLELEFPLHGGPVSSEVMDKWWRANGKIFNWAALPTELKENVIRFCLHDPRMLASSSARLATRRSSRKANRVPLLQLRGPHEIIDKFDRTSSLLRVSHQVRVIALRLCLQGIIGNPRLDGLCISIVSGGQLKNCIRRLGKFPQTLHPDGVPTDEKTQALAKLYKQYPRIYSHLDQYATFAHGIRKVHMRMDYYSYFRFFKLTVGGLRGSWPRLNPGYDMLERLPSLNELVIELPDPDYMVSNLSSHVMPPLFYPGFECPRILHRFIYEQVAEVLALYPNVKLLGFIDELEEQRFYTLRSGAIEGLKFTNAELADLYKDDGGGIELDSVIYPGTPSHETEDSLAETRNAPMDLYDYGFWPPKCRCAVLCRKVLFPHQ
ncbi:hypothetical protein J1614_007527 [Plenodomus biglobosus]|nr:hypothetical protein J1614_007527 [Plenodomus biglobosus]